MSRTAVSFPSALVLAVALAACAGDGTSPPQTAFTTPSVPRSSAPPPSAPPSPPASPTSSAQVIDVQYVRGKITGVEQRVPVKLGEQVVIRVTSDVAEEIHVHGYDLYVDLAPGQPAEIDFVADLPGAYEVELHGAGRPLFQLRVA
ncbi:MAG: hypothetical protein WD794_14175 [Mycobacteriales bacterium]